MDNGMIRLREPEEASSISDWSDLIDVIAAAADRLDAAGCARETCVELIASEIGKARVSLTRRTKAGNESVEDENLFRWDIQPNDWQNASDFWRNAGRRLVSQGECLIVPLNGKLYVADTYQMRERALAPTVFEDVTLRMAGGGCFRLRRKWNSSEALFVCFRRDRLDRRLKAYVEDLCKLVDNLATSMMLTNAPKLALTVPAQLTLVERETGKKLTLREYADSLKGLLDTDKTAIIGIGNGMELKPLAIEAKAGMADIDKAINDVERAIAQSYGIPWTVYTGTVTEKSDAWHDFMSAAVLPYARAIERALNGAIVGAKGFRRGERMHFTLAYNRHADMLSCATSLEKLVGIGKTLDEIDEALGIPPAGTEETRTRALTKNFDRGARDDNAEDD